MATITTRKNKDGEITSCTIRVYHGYDGSGERLKPYIMTYKPASGMTLKQIEKEVKRQAGQFEEQCKSGLIGSATKISLNEYAPQYLAAKKNTLSPATYQYYEIALKTVIQPALGHIKINEMNSAHVQAFVNQLIKKPIAPKKAAKDPPGPTEAPKALQPVKYLAASTVRRYLTILQSVLKLAVKQKLIKENPARAELLELPKALAPKVEIFTKQEAAEMLELLENEELQFQVLIQLAIMTGARRGELVALQFADFDYRTNKVTISKAAVKLKGAPAKIKPPKDYEVRTVAISRECIALVESLREEKKREAARLGTAWKEGDWLFTQWNGEMMNPQTPTKQFNGFLESNELKHRKFHSLRHTSATLLLYGGVNIKQVQERLGHGDIETTNKYLHCIAEADEAAADVLRDMLITKIDTDKTEKKA